MLYYIWKTPINMSFPSLNYAEAMFTRRKFIKAGALTGVFMPFAGAVMRSGHPSPEKVPVPGVSNEPSSERLKEGISYGPVYKEKSPGRFDINFFTKDLDGYEAGFMMECLAMAGADGLDLVVRNGGRVEPSRVVDDLPEMVSLGNKYNLPTGMIVTGITSAKDRETTDVLKTASALGIGHYRLGYYRYDLDAGIINTIESIKGQLKDLSDMNRNFNIQAGYQNHSGGMVGTPGWDVWEIIKDFPFETISSQFDIRHATVGGPNSWRFIMHLLGKNIGSLAIKDFTWHIDNGKAHVVNVPLGEGIVDFDLYFQTIRELQIDVPFTLHVEYPLYSKQEEGLSPGEKQKIIVRQIKKDIDFIRKYETS
jgi:L-ribulose-5-phosphate 3-epimerase